MISVNDISMRYGARVLFEEVTATFLPGRRYAITGPNGSGKSTFMKILTGEIEPAKGSVTRPKKIGILRQDQFAFDAYRVLDTVIMGNAPLWDALQEREKFYANPDEWTDEDGMRLGELEGIVGDEGGYTAEADAATLLQGLDIPESLHERKMSELQGGQKVRVLLAQALFGNASVLLLDEPTNNLDLESVHWLQRYLLAYDGCLIVISHDRHFLNEVCTHTADIDYESIITYTGGYDDMVLAKTQIRSRVEAGNAQREKKIAQLNEFIARFSAGTRSSQVTSRKKEVERLQTSDLAKSNIQRPYIRFENEASSGRHPLEIKGLSKSYDDLTVIQNFTASIARGEKIALLGRNGAGKTTMLRSLLRNATGFVDAPEREFPIDGGVVTWGHEVAVGYFSQDHKESIRPGVDAARMAARVRSQRIAAGAARPARSDAVQRRRRHQAHRESFRRRSRAPHLLPPDAAEAELPAAGRAHQPLGPGIHQRPEHRAAEVRRHGPPGHARSRSGGRSRHPHLAFRESQISKTSRVRTPTS